jgi:UDP-3-O-[3-hydroxymyristoyl] glucosamine N-acyltransferase
MYDRHENSYYASEICEFLDKELHGENCVIYEPRSIRRLKDHSLVFVDNIFCKDFDYSLLAGFRDVLVITNTRPEKIAASLVLSDNPRLDFVRVLKRFFVELSPAESHPTAVIHPKAHLGRNVAIGAHSYIGPDVSIGDETRVYQNVVITGNVAIGKRCVIKPNATIGSEGFSFVFDQDRVEHFPQIGGIVIGDDVWVGANSSIEKAALDDTIIEDGAKIDDLVQVGHGAKVGRQSMVTSGVVICGRATIGERVWLAPNSTVDTGVAVGSRAFVGMNSVVLKNVPDNMVVAGAPARVLRERRSTE